MAKRVRPARSYQHPDHPVRRLADAAIPKLKRSMKTSLKAAKRLFDPAQAVNLLRAGRYREVAGIIDWHHSDEAMRHPLAMLGDVWLAGGAIGARKINGAFNARRRVVRFKKMAGAEESKAPTILARGLRAPQLGTLSEDAFAAMIIAKDQSDLFNYDRFDPVTQTHIRDFQDAMIAQLGEDSRATIEETILAGMRMGLGPEEIVDQIRAVIGLTDRQATAVLNFRRMLMDLNPAALGRSLANSADLDAFRAAVDSGTSLAMERVDAMVANYAENYLDYRALSIATTEATRAASLGLQDSYTQAVDRGVMPAEAVTQYWQISLDEKTCFPAGTKVSAPLGDMPIELLRPGHFVWTRSGPCLVLAVSSKAYSQTVVALFTDDGASISCTMDHRIMVNGSWCEAREIKPGDLLHSPGDKRVKVTRAVHFEFADPHRMPAPSEQARIASGVLSRVMPVDPVHFYGQFERHHGEVDEIATDAVLLVKFDLAGQGDADGFLWRSFTLEPAVAAHRAERSVSLTGASAHGLPAAPAVRHYGRPPAGLRAMLASPVGGLQKILATSLALDMADYGEPAFAGADIIPVGIGGGDRVALAAPRTDLIHAVRFVHDVLLHGSAKVYDIEVQGAHEFFANGLLAHNCDHCLSVVDNNPDGVGLGDQFDSDDGPIDGPPYHPNCRCSLEFVTNLDLVPDEE